MFVFNRHKFIKVIRINENDICWMVLIHYYKYTRNMLNKQQQQQQNRIRKNRKKV